MSPTDVDLLVGLLLALGGAAVAWLKASTAEKQAATNAAKVADLATASAVHGAKIDGLLGGQVQAIMAPTMASAAELASRATAAALATALAAGAGVGAPAHGADERKAT